jgi:hypothetical protein
MKLIRCVLLGVCLWSMAMFAGTVDDGVLGDGHIDHWVYFLPVVCALGFFLLWRVDLAMDRAESKAREVAFWRAKALDVSDWEKVKRQAGVKSS